MANQAKTKESPSNESRFVPFTVAGIVCFAAAAFLGIGSWYLFGTSRRLAPEKELIAVQTSGQNTLAVENSNAAANALPANNAAAIELKKAPTGEAVIEGGEVTLGGEENKLPLRRVAVKSFSIALTEVTNEHYAEFVEETKRAAPTGWKDNKFPGGAGEEPVVNVSYADANAYCEWLSKKLGATVRLPSEAEWELAAGGANNFKYPWGKEWTDEAAASKETSGKIRSVKSFPKGRAASGAYDMVGNVWEWTSDLFVDAAGNPVLFEKTRQRVIKGGAATETRDFLTTKARAARPENKPRDVIGFRYVIARE